MPYQQSPAELEEERLAAAALGSATPGQSAWQGAPAGAPQPEGNGAGQSYQDFLSGGQSGPTQTGFLNFDYFGAANQDVAKREAKRVNEGVANKAKKAKTGVQNVNQRYLDALGGAPPTPGFDANGGWLGGAAGPSTGGVATNPDGSVDAAPAAPGQGAPASGMPGDYRSFLEQQAAAMGQSMKGVPNFTDTEGYEETGDDVREAQRQLNALAGLDADGKPLDGGTDAGIGTLAGGNWADAALLGHAGRQAFQGTRDAYGKKGTGHDSLRDYADAVADNATDMGRQRRKELAARGSEYEAALGAFDAKAAADKAGVSAGGAPTDEVVGGGTRQELADRVKKFSEGKSKDMGGMLWKKGVQGLSQMSPEKWGEKNDMLGQFTILKDISAQYGFEGDEGERAFSEFWGSLDPDTKMWIISLTSGSGSEVGKGVLNLFGGLGDQLHKATTGTNSSPEEWSTYQQMVGQFMKDRRAKKSADKGTIDRIGGEGANEEDIPTDEETEAERIERARGRHGN